MRPGQPFSLGPLRGRVQDVQTSGSDVEASLHTPHGTVRVLARARWRGLVLLITDDKEGT